MILELQTTSFLWLFQLDDSKSLHKKWLFHQTSIKKWLFRVPGLYVEHDLWCVCLFSYHKNNWSKKTELVQDHFICWVVPLPSSSQDHWRYHLQNKWWFLWSLLLERGTKPYGNIFFAGRVFVLEINKCDTVGFAFWNFQPTIGNRAGDIFPQQTLTAFCPKISSLPKKERGKTWQDVSCWDCWIFVGVTSICHSFEQGTPIWNTLVWFWWDILLTVISPTIRMVQSWLCVFWGYSPPTNSETIICSFLWRAPYKPALSTVSGPGISSMYAHN